MLSRPKFAPTAATALLLTLLTLAPTAQSQSTDPTALVRRAIQNREAAAKTHRPLRYQLRKISDHRDTTKDIIETDQGDVARLIAIDNHSMTAEADQAELGRLNTLAKHPEIQEHRHQREQNDADRINRLMRLLPDAFLYRDQGTSPCPSGKGPCHHLTFAPNPAFEPPDVEANIFRGLAGDLWIDQAQERLARLDAHVIANVDFGWGILGKLDKGGSIQLEQSDLGNHDWELTTLKLNLKGKALLLKSLDVRLTEEASHFSQVPPGVDYRKAIQLLEKSTPMYSSVLFCAVPNFPQPVKPWIDPAIQSRRDGTAFSPARQCRVGKAIWTSPERDGTVPNLPSLRFTAEERFPPATASSHADSLEAAELRFSAPTTTLSAASLAILT